MKEIHQERTNTPNYIYLKQESKYYQIQENKINWVYAKGNHCTFYMEAPKEYTFRLSLTYFLKNSATTLLVRCHRNYVINANKIDIYAPSSHVVINNQVIPIGKKYKQEIEDRLCLIG